MRDNASPSLVHLAPLLVLAIRELNCEFSNQKLKIKKQFLAIVICFINKLTQLLLLTKHMSLKGSNNFKIQLINTNNFP
jgi:hypothetical protein